MFFKKNKSVLLNAFTTNAVHRDIYPIAPAKRFVPDWLKNLKYNTNPNNFLNYSEEQIKFRAWGTMNGCPATMNVFANGFIVPFPFDVIVARKNNEVFMTNSADHQSPADGLESMGSITKVPKDHRKGWAEEFENFKISFAWRLVCNEPINFALIDPPFRNEFSEDLFAVTGLIDFKYNRNVSLHLMIKKKGEDKTFKIPAGHPAYYILPVTEKEVSLNVEMLTEDEMHKKAPRYGTFGKLMSGYATALNLLKGERAKNK